MSRASRRRARIFGRVRIGLGLVAAALLLQAAVTALRVTEPDWADRTSDRYAKAAALAVQEGDDVAAALYWRKILQRTPWDRATRFELALSLERQGRLEKARTAMAALAPRQATGYLPAQRWLTDALHDRVLGGDREAAPELVDRARQLVLADGDDVRALAQMADGWLAAGDLQQATGVLLDARRRDPALGLRLARVQARLGDLSIARRTARQTIEACREAENSSAKAASLLCVAETYVFLEDFEAARGALAAITDPADARLARSMTELAHLESGGSEPEGIGLDALVDHLVELSASHRGLDSRLARLAGRRDGVGVTLRARLDSIDDLPVGALFRLGTDAAIRGDIDTARRHLEAAHLRLPESSEIANNLAWVLAEGDPPDLIRSLALANQAVDAAPREASFRETRGQILLQRGEFAAALSDLELALRAVPDRRPVHESLAEAYEALGEPALAKRHREAASRG